MAKQFAIDVDFRVTKRIYVDAETAEQAEQMVEERCKANPYQYTSNIDACTDYSIIEVSECEDDTDADPLKPALDYVCEQLGTERTVAIRMQVTYNMKHRMPVNTGIDDAHVIDLLEEYGQDNDLPEGWWENEGDIDDILLEL
jgi:antitoxin component of RelBE/YafQ-DinJ toxin-antitoxin module